MTKNEIASYLCSISTLLKDQDAAGVHGRSQTLAAEFEKHWDLLKSEIQKEQASETRKREFIEHGRDETRRAHNVGEPGRGSPDREGLGPSRSSPATNG